MVINIWRICSTVKFIFLCNVMSQHRGHMKSTFLLLDSDKWSIWNRKRQIIYVNILQIKASRYVFTCAHTGQTTQHKYYSLISLPKVNHGVLVVDWLKSKRIVNRAKVHLSQGVQHHVVRSAMYWHGNKPVSWTIPLEHHVAHHWAHAAIYGDQENKSRSLFLGLHKWSSGKN